MPLRCAESLFGVFPVCSCVLTWEHLIGIVEVQKCYCNKPGVCSNHLFSHYFYAIRVPDTVIF